MVEREEPIELEGLTELLNLEHEATLWADELYKAVNFLMFLGEEKKKPQSQDLVQKIANAIRRSLDELE